MISPAKLLSQYKYFLPFDVFERHKFIASFITKNDTVLDVGGSLSHLGDFSCPRELITCDVRPPADFLYDGKKIPFENKSFDIVTALDVLEHIKKEERKNFLGELLRVAKKKVLISAPLGTASHIAFEKKILTELQKKGKEIKFLEEHVKYGLPTLLEIKNITKDYFSQIVFSGNLKTTHFLFKIHDFEFKNPFLNKIWFFGKLFLNLWANIFLYPRMINLQYNENINRFYLITNRE